MSLLSAPRTIAALGERVESLTQDQKGLMAKRASADVFKKYTTQELVSDSTTLKEFINQDGIIFAVTWKGIATPDLSVVLGNYYIGYKDMHDSKEREPGKRTENLNNANLVVQKWGHMMSIRGRAYDPSLVPQGVSVNDIQ